MCYCYICDTVLCEFNNSTEHIIPNALGGRLTSRYVLCTKCNSKFGSEVDKVLSDKINLPTILNIARDRGTVQKITGKTSSGRLYILDNELKPSYDKIKAYKTTDNKRAFVVRNEKEARRILNQIKKKKPNLDIEKEISQIEWKEEYIEEPVFFENDILDGKAAFRAITKIAVGFHCHSLKDTWNTYHLIPFLKGKSDMFIVYHHFPKEVIYTPAEEEISHLLFLKGDNKERLLYCYLELFNCHNFLVVLNQNYLGFNFEKIYVYDLMNQTELNIRLNFSISREELDAMKPPGPKDTQLKFFDKLRIVYEKRGLKLILRDKESKS